MTFLMMMLILCVILVFAIPVGGTLYEIRKAEKIAEKQEEDKLTATEREVVKLVLDKFMSLNKEGDFFILTHYVIAFERIRIDLEHLDNHGYFTIKIADKVSNTIIPGSYFTKEMRKHHEELYQKKLAETDRRLAKYREETAKEALVEVKKMFGKK